ncbi:MAG: universal stress protein [Sedimenticola sp.]|nr:universal stress protein [Sedimenticola sp.]
MSSRQSVGYHSIVAAISPDQAGQPAAIRAANVAAKLQSQVTLAHIASLSQPANESLGTARHLMNRLSTEHPEITLLKSTRGNWLDMVQLSDEVSGDLIVLDTPVHDQLVPLLREHEDDHCDHGECDVLVIGRQQSEDDAATDYAHILVAADLTDQGLMTLYKAVRMAKRYTARLTLLNVVEQGLTDSEEALQSAIELRQRGLEACTSVIEGLKVETRVTTAETGVDQAVADYAASQDCDLIVIGSHKFKGLCVLLGNTTAGVIGGAGIDALVVHE